MEFIHLLKSPLPKAVIAHPGIHVLKIGILILILHACNHRQNTDGNPYELVPHNAFGILQINDHVELRPALQENKMLAYWQKKNPQLGTVLSELVPSKPSRGDLLVFSPKGKETFATTFIGLRPLSDSLPLPYPQIKNYEGIPIHQHPNSFYEARMGSLRMRSTTLLTLENCIRNYNQRQTENTPLRRVEESLNLDSEANLLIHPKESLLDQSLLPVTPFLSSKTSEWLALDIELEEPLEVDGVTLLNDSLANPINWLQSLEQKGSLLPTVIPDTADEFFSFPISNMAQLETNFRRFTQLRNMAVSVVDLRDLSLVDELGWIRKNKNSGLFMHLTTLENEFPLLVEQNNPKRYRGTTYFQVELPQTIAKFSKAFGQKATYRWGTLLGDFALFTENEDFLKYVITNFKDGRVMAKKTAYQSLEDTFSGRGSFLWVAQTALFFDPKHFPSESYPLIGLQGVGETDFVHLHFRLGLSTQKKQKGQVTSLANFSLDAPLAQGPQWLKNHRTKGMDVAVQDTQNQLYLFSNKGNLYWKKDLKEPIIGPIQQVDLYKNKKWQMAFRTANYLYVLDRNGKEVKPFKIKLPKAKKPLPLAVFDYDNNKKYRFVIAQDKKLLLYDKEGKRVQGFKRAQLQSPLMHPPKHARIKKKDYLLLQRANGTLGILNRVGNDRIRVSSNLNFSGTPLFQYLDTFATTDMDGNLVQIDTRGNVIKSPYELKPGHSIDATNKSLISLSENTLTIKGIPVTLPYGNYTPPKIFYLNNILYITTTDQESQKVFLYYSNGTPVSGFPVYGVGPADLSLDNKKNTQLVVSGEDKSLLIYRVSQ